MNVFNERLAKRIQHRSRIVIGFAHTGGRLVLRMASNSYGTHLDDSDMALDILKWTAERLVEEEQIIFHALQRRAK